MMTLMMKIQDFHWLFEFYSEMMNQMNETIDLEIDDTAKTMKIDHSSMMRIAL